MRVGEAGYYDGVTAVAEEPFCRCFMTWLYALRALPPVRRHRYAIPFFLGPQFDCVIECLPTCASPDNPPHWPPITYAAWQEDWYDANYDPKVQKDLVA